MSPQYMQLVRYLECSRSEWQQCHKPSPFDCLGDHALLFCACTEAFTRINFSVWCHQATQIFDGFIVDVLFASVVNFEICLRSTSVTVIITHSGVLSSRVPKPIKCRFRKRGAAPTHSRWGRRESQIIAELDDLSNASTLAAVC